MISHTVLRDCYSFFYMTGIHTSDEYIPKKDVYIYYEKHEKKKKKNSSRKR